MPRMTRHPKSGQFVKKAGGGPKPKGGTTAPKAKPKPAFLKKIGK
jgi:hypothetical protein